MPDSVFSSGECSAAPHDPQPLSCKIGGGVSLVNIAVSIILSRALKQTGAVVKREVPIPEFQQLPIPEFQQLATVLPPYEHNDLDPEEHKNSLDAIMDVVAYLPTGEEYLVDASIRNLLAKRYAAVAFSDAGCAAVCGENDKINRYPEMVRSRFVANQRFQWPKGS